MQLWLKDVSALKDWLSRTTNFLSPDCQHKILQLLNDSVWHIIGRPIMSSLSHTNSVRLFVRGAVNCGETAEAIRIKFGTDAVTGPGTKALKFGPSPEEGGLPRQNFPMSTVEK